MKQISASQVKAWLRAKKWWVVSATILLVLVFVLAIMPVVISQQFQKWVLANGGEKVSVENIDFNPFTAKLGLYNIVIEHAGFQPFLLPELQLHAQWHDLFRRRFVINSIMVNGVKLTVDQSQQEHSHVGGILLKNLVTENTTEKQQDGKPWYLQVHDLQLNDFQLVYQQQKLKSVINVETLSLTGLNTDPESSPATLKLKSTVDNALVVINGNADLFSTTPGFNGKLVIKSFNASPYLVLAPEQMRNNQLTVSIDSQVNIEKTGESGLTVEQDGQITFDDIAWLDADTDIKASQVSWRGAIDIISSSAKDLTVNTDGMLRADKLGLNARAAELLLENEQFVWQGKADTRMPGSSDIKVVLNGQLLNSKLDLDLNQQKTLVKNDNLNWQGKADIHLLADGSLKINSEGQIQDEALRIERAEQEFLLETEAFAWQGDIAIGKLANAMTIESLSDMKLSGLRMNTLEESERLVTAKEIKADKVNIKSIDEVLLKSLSLSGFSIGHPLKLEQLPATLDGFLNYEEVIVDQVNYSTQQGIEIKSIAQSGVKHVISRDTSGGWNFNSFPLLKAVQKRASNDSAETTVAATETEKKLPLKIGSITVAQGGELYFVDHTSHKTFSQKIEIDSFKLSDIDSENQVAGSKLSLGAKLDNAFVVFDGNISVFAAQPTFDLKGEVQALSLLPYSVFMEKALGYEVDSGSLDANTSLKAEKGKLESETDLILHQLDIKALTEAELKAIDAKLNSGLETGLSMLKDKHDTIKLNVPVNGSFDNIQVDPSDIINQALGSAMKKGAKTYFAAALFPFGTLLVIADAASDKAMQVQLDPVFFTAGADSMDSKYHAYLEKVAKVLDEKPEIHVKVCGVSTASDSRHFEGIMKKAFVEQQQAAAAKSANEVETVKDSKDSEGKGRSAQPEFIADKAAIEKQVKELAIKRAAVVTDFLVKTQSVKPNRLISCQPRLELDSADAKPRSDLLL